MVHPIAGTRHRGATPQEDQALAEELLADPKERAEHLMLVDLGRNDLGRVCKPGSVHVVDFFKVERYSHVMHIVSTVTGELADGKTAYDAVAACFPAGSMTGAPKLRTLEIIDRLEGRPRGVYSGALGFLSVNGTADLNVVIRTLVASPGGLTIGAGGAIVAASDPQAELEEMLIKARPLLEAVGGTLEGGSRVTVASRSSGI
jgi:anthranilate synthase component 1